MRGDVPLGVALLLGKLATLDWYYVTAWREHRCYDGEQGRLIGCVGMSHRGCFVPVYAYSSTGVCNIIDEG